MLFRSGDITLRALEVLKKSDVILCEDTRVSKKLLSYYNINKRLISYHKFNEKKNLKDVINILKDNQIVSLISDAGTPSISDPGKILINSCVKENILIVPIPGASAITAALSISGFSNEFYFHGFLSDTDNSIKKELELFNNLNCSIVFFISVQKLNKKFDLLKEAFPEREIIICRELTKLHETIYRGKISEFNKLQFISKGEVTVIISEKKNSNKKDNLDESNKKKLKS